MSELQAVRAAIIKTVPELKYVPSYPYNPDVAKAIVALEKIANKTLWNGDLEMTSTMMIERYKQQQNSDYITMLRNEYPGRPIRLSDVLVAIRKKKSNFYDEDDEVAMEFAHRDLQETVMELLGLYDLLKDDISLQSSPCIHFLHTLLAEK